MEEKAFQGTHGVFAPQEPCQSPSLSQWWKRNLFINNSFVIKLDGSQLDHVVLINFLVSTCRETLHF